MARRALTSDDEKVWRFVTRQVNPLHERRHPETEDARSEDDVPQVVTRALEVSPPPRAAPRPLSALVLGGTADIDRRTAQRFKRGEMAVDGRIDLHGLTLDQAHVALVSFVRSAAARGDRCVVVVTGKGKAPGVGKIKRETRHWLNQAPLRGVILAVSEARHRDGGSGALYVLLKRKRAE